MFEPSSKARVFGLPPGVDFPDLLVKGLMARLAGTSAEQMARVQLIVNTRRMARRIRDLFDQGPPSLLPRINLLTDLGEDWNSREIPPPVPPLRRRLELTQLVAGLLEQQPDLAPRSALFDLADSLANLMDEMHGEGISPDAIADLDITDQSGHWSRIKAFLSIVRHFFDGSHAAPDAEARQRLVIERLVETWVDTPPDHPVIIAGSTGSRGATQLLMQSVARLPQGALVLPGFDWFLPEHVWTTFDDTFRSEDHPQFRFFKLLNALNLKAADIEKWHAVDPPNVSRNKLVSLALRPAPVTDQWLNDGPSLGDLSSALENVTLTEAPSARTEALAIAMRLRHAAENAQTAALITPDRTLTRQVTAALDQWDILPDDSAGQPLHLSPPGRFLRHVAELFGQPLTAATLLTLLKHPLTHSAGQRNTHLRLTRELELHLRRNGPPYPGPEDFAAWAEAQRDPLARVWSEWLATCFCGRDVVADESLETRVTTHLDLAELIADGCQPDGESELWKETAGREALKATTELRNESSFGGLLNARDYASLFHSILSRHEVRNPDKPHPHILIWGTLEARVQGADLVILAGLNEGTWPSNPDPDPWLNRTLRHQAGLLLPERRIGLSAHDFQQAISAREVWLTRSIRSDDAETVASRWMYRLTNLLNGLPDQNGPELLNDMRSRGETWLALGRAFEQPETIEPAKRPAPRPPETARPKQLSVTEIKRLIRDPYAIYAKHILKLRRLDPLMKAPDALMRGVILHSILEEFVRETIERPDQCTRDHLMHIAETVLAENVPWAAMRVTWLARLDRVAQWFVDTELARRSDATPSAFEVKGSASLSALDFRLTATADRIDQDKDGNLHIYDYKTGAPPSAQEQLYFDKQLLLEAAIAERTGFGDIAPAHVARAVFIGLASGGKEVPAPLESEPPEKIWREFEALIASYSDPKTGYTSRRALHSKTDQGDYDQLARYGEWDITDDPDPEEVVG